LKNYVGLTIKLLLLLTSLNAAAEERWEFKGDTAYDKAFNLTWQRCAIGQKLFDNSCVGGGRAMNHMEAQKEEKDGWRLPTRDDLNSLMKKTEKPMVDPKVFPGFECCYYWTSELHDGDEQRAWYVMFDRGDMSYRDRKSSMHLIRLVRTGRQ